jgi:AraC family transcriptional regulator, activator of mtrCDE
MMAHSFGILPTPFRIWAKISALGPVAASGGGNAGHWSHSSIDPTPLTYGASMKLVRAEWLNIRLIRLTRHDVIFALRSRPMDWLSRLLDMMPVSGHLDIRCFYGAPWRLDEVSSQAGEIPYHVVVRGSALLEGPWGGVPRHLTAGDILILPHGSAHTLHDGSGAPPAPARDRAALNLTISENAGTGERLDMMCGRFVLTQAHDRLLRTYLPPILVVSAPDRSARPGTGQQLAGLVNLMRDESAVNHLAGRAMLNALSTAMFALILRLASESADAPVGLLAIASHPRLAPALAALFNEPDRPWSLPQLARLCHMSRATMARHFQKLGRTAHGLLTDIRVTLAANKLRHSTTSIPAVAEAAGYHSEAAFQRVFKRRLGMTPAQWRRASAQD